MIEISPSAAPDPLLLAGGGEVVPSLGIVGGPFGAAGSDLAEAGGGALVLLWSALTEAEDREGGGALAGDGVAPMKKVASPSGLDAFADPLDGDGDGELDEEAEAGRGASRPTSGLFPPRTGSSGGAGFGSDDGDEYHSFGEEAEASSQFQVDVEEVESWEKEQVWEGLRVLRWCTPRLAASRQ